MFCEAATGRQLERVATRVSAGIVRPEFGKRKTADGIGTAPGNGGFHVLTWHGRCLPDFWGFLGEAHR